MTAAEDPSHERLVAYAAESLSVEDAFEVEEHVAGCPDCARITHRAFQFEDLANATFREHGDFVRRAVLEAALVSEEARAAPGLRERLSAWRTAWSGHAEAAASIAFKATEAGTRVAAAGVECLTRSGSPWQLAPVMAGTVRGTGEAATSALLTTTPSSDLSSARVAAHGGKAPEITVRLDGLPGKLRPLVFLVPWDSTTPAALTMAERPPGEDYLVARFEKLAVGHYVVAIEPLPDQEDGAGAQ